LDVNTNPANPIIGERAFGTTAQDVISHALPFMRGLLDAGVLPCGKHFPGHGDTDRDSHLQLPVVARSRNQLNQIELPPFCAAIESGIPMLMTAHVLYPCLDEHNPATLSRTILDSLLREEMGFDGVLVSDDLEMRAVSADQSVPDLSVRSLQAGVDWLLICNDPEAAVLAARRIRDAVREGTIDASAASAAAERIDRLRTRLTARRTGELPFPEHASLNAQVRALAGAAGA
jgi:beta-N-acetylhexosaminidase